MKLHAGSLYKNTLVLYGEENIPHIIFFFFGEEGLQWKIYCNDVEFEAKNSEFTIVTFDGISYKFKYVISNDPMKFLRFSQ